MKVQRVTLQHNKEFKIIITFILFIPKYPKIDVNDEKLSSDTFFLDTQTNSKSSEDVSHIIGPEWFVEKTAVKRPQIGLGRKICNLNKMSSVLKRLFILYKTS